MYENNNFLNSSNILYSHQKIQCLSLIDFRLQARLKPEVLSFNQFTSILNIVPNLQNFSSILRFQTTEKELLKCDYVDVKNWKNFAVQLHELVTLNCSIKCYLNSSYNSEIYVGQIIANLSDRNNRLIPIYFDSNNKSLNNTKHYVGIYKNILYLRQIIKTNHIYNDGFFKFIIKQS